MLQKDKKPENAPVTKKENRTHDTGEESQEDEETQKGAVVRDKPNQGGSSISKVTRSGSTPHHKGDCQKKEERHIK